MSVNDCMAFGECGRFPLSVDYYYRCIKYWLKLLLMHEHRYPKYCYFMLKDFDELGRLTWASSVKHLYLSLSQTSPGFYMSAVHVF